MSRRDYSLKVYSLKKIGQKNCSRMDPLLVDVCVVQKRLCLTSLILTVKRTSNPNFWRTLLGRFYCFDRSEYGGLCANPNTSWMGDCIIMRTLILGFEFTNFRTRAQQTGVLPTEWWFILTFIRKSDQFAPFQGRGPKAPHGMHSWERYTLQGTWHYRNYLQQTFQDIIAQNEWTSFDIHYRL